AGELVFAGAVRPKAQKLHLAIGLASEQHPLSVGRHRDLGLIDVIVGEPANVAAVQVGGVKLGALRVVERVGVIPLRQVGMIAGRGADDPLAIGEIVGAGGLALAI